MRQTGPGLTCPSWRLDMSTCRCVCAAAQVCGSVQYGTVLYCASIVQYSTVQVLGTRSQPRHSPVSQGLTRVPKDS